MAHIVSQLSFRAGPLVTPVPGNDNIGGACYDGNGQALYAVYDGGAVKVFRTRAGYQKLRLEDGSVDYLSTVLTAAVVTPEPVSVAIQRIGGVIYASISGWFTDGRAGSWIYRDTGGGGAGPWVLHGTIQEISGATGGDDAGMTPFASEITVLGDGSWATNAPVWGNYSAGTSRRGGVYTSTDGGVTWTNRLNIGWYLVGGSYGIAWSRNFGQFGGAWYVGGLGTYDAGKHFKSADCVNWTDIGNLGTDGSSDVGYSFPISDAEWIYRWAPGGAYDSSRVLQSAPTAPETMPLWANVVDTTPMTFWATSKNWVSFPLMCNIGTDRAQLWIATNFGRVLSIAATPSMMPPCRQYPREDGLGTSSARRIFPQARSQQGGIRRAGGTYY